MSPICAPSHFGRSLHHNMVNHKMVNIEPFNLSIAFSISKNINVRNVLLLKEVTARVVREIPQISLASVPELYL